MNHTTVSWLSCQDARVSGQLSINYTQFLKPHKTGASSAKVKKSASVRWLLWLVPKQEPS